MCFLSQILPRIFPELLLFFGAVVAVGGGGSWSFGVLPEKLLYKPTTKKLLIVTHFLVIFITIFIIGLQLTIIFRIDQSADYFYEIIDYWFIQ